MKARKPVIASVSILLGISMLAGVSFFLFPPRPSDVPSATARTWSEIGQELLAECQEYEFFITNTPAGRGENIEAWLTAVKRISGGKASQFFLTENPVIEDFASLEVSNGLRILGEASLNSLIANGGPWNMARLQVSYPETFEVLSYNTANKALEVCGLKEMTDNLSALAVNSKLIVQRAANFTKSELEEDTATNPGGPETLAQENARRVAEDYLAYSSFSRKGLIDQLIFEGFDRSDAAYGVDATSTDWNKQAALTAREYLDFRGFSREALREQLIFEGFTPSEAFYGLTAVGY